MLSMLLAMFLFTVGIGFLYFVERDSYMQLRSEKMERATCLAQAGVDYVCWKDVHNPDFFKSAPQTLSLNTTGTEVVEIAYDSSLNLYRCTGRVVDAMGNTVASRTVVLPAGTTAGGARQEMYDEGL